MKNLLYVCFISLLIASCTSAPKEYTPCECNKIMSGENKTEENKAWCTAKVASDEKFSNELTKCAAEAMGFDSSQVKIQSNKPMAAETGKYTVNTAKSKVKWTGRKPASAHIGEVQVKSGEFVVNEQGALVSGQMVIDMTSISVTDIKDEKSNGDLVGHLKADDFFGADKFPEASYNVTSATRMENSNTNYKVEGDLTIKGITKPASAMLMVVKSKKVKGNVSIAGGLKFDRTD